MSKTPQTIWGLSKRHSGLTPFLTPFVIPFYLSAFPRFTRDAVLC
jgi:hypothetical protein